MRVTAAKRGASMLLKRSFATYGAPIQPGWFKRLTETNHYDLPRLPIPRLEDTIQRYLNTIQPLVSEEEWQEHANLAQQFMDQEGRKLQDELLKRELNQVMGKAYPFSYIEQDWDQMYLGGRYEAPINVNPAYGLEDETEAHLKDSVPRTAAFVRSLVKWWDKVKSGDLEQDPNQCMSAFAKQLGSAKIPRQGMDQLMCSPRSSHIAVLHNGQYFQLHVLSPDGKQLISKKDLEEQLEAIWNSNEADGRDQDVDISALTAAERDEWAQLRERLIQDDVNKASLETIDSALFVLVLNEQDANSVKERMDLALHGNGRHRWFDKLQIGAQKDGHLTINFEHSHSDGTVWNRWLHEVWHDMRQSDSGYSPLKNLPDMSKAPAPEILRWNLSNNLVESIKKAESNFMSFRQTLNSDFLQYTNLTKKHCKEWKLSPDGVAQMAFQLAFYRSHGHVPPTYESCSTRGYLHGRTETIRSATPDAAAFVKAVEAGAALETQQDLMNVAIDNHVQMAKAAQRGNGVDRHLMALANIAKESGVSSEFLASPVRAKSSAFQISSSNVTTPLLNYFLFGAVVPDGYGLGYLMLNDSVNLSMTSFNTSDVTDLPKFKTSVAEAFDTIKALADSSKM